MGIAVTPLSTTLGAEITGATIRADMSPADFRTVENALHEHLVVVIRDQKLAPEDFVAFSTRFGRPEPHVIDQYHHKADPNILILSNRRNEKGENIGLADGGTYFHSDYSYLAVPARCTMLHAIEIPGGDAGTTFANQRKAYEDLPAPKKNEIDGLVCRHHYGNRDNLDKTSRTAASGLSDDQEAKMKWERHPLVRNHPHTGRKSLYAVSGSSFGIEGMDDDKGLALLNELKTHSTDRRYCYTPEYRPGDIVIWDNCSLLHSAPLIDPDKPRTLWRITVKEAGPTL
ncbi:MAG: TauD/TfdA dioxygenase family protein [Pseudorhodoplanes sp.]